MLDSVGGTEFRLQVTTEPWELDIDTIVISGGSAGLGGLGVELQDAVGPIEVDLAALSPEQPQRVGLEGLVVVVGSVRLPSPSGGEGPPTIGAVATTAAASVRLAAVHGCQRIAIPLLGAGVAGLDRTEVADVLVAAVREELAARTEVDAPDEVTFLAFDEGEEDAIRLAWTGHSPQALANDRPQGQDLLGIRTEVRALAEMLLMRDVPPPLAVGVLGGWGSGKSFVLRLMQERMVEIRSTSLRANQCWVGEHLTPHVGHVYQIQFNAWTYARADLWAALMQRVLNELDRQLVVEQHLDKAEGGLLDGARWASVSKLPAELHRLYDTVGAEVEGRGDLFDSLRKVHDADRKALDASKEKLAKLQADEAVRRDQLRRLVEETVAVDLDKAHWQPLREMAAKAIGVSGDTLQDWVDREAPGLSGQASAVAGSVEDARRLASNLRHVQAPAGQVARTVWHRNVAACVVFVLAAMAIPWALVQWNDELGALTLPAGMGALLAGAASALRLLTSWLGVVRRFGERVDEWRRGVETEITRVESTTAARVQQEAAGDDALKQTQAEIAKAERDVARLRDRVRLVDEFRSVGDLVGARLKSGTYEERLGVMQTISDDLTSLTESLTVATEDIHEAEKRKLFPRGPARVVLFIDDLDRCPPPKVVEVLEAVQLLLATDLFVVVIALDVRYVTKALEKEYAGVLAADGEPSGIDYLEKIVQIPYRTRGLRPESAERFLAGNLRVAPVAAADGRSATGGGVGANGDAPPAGREEADAKDVLTARELLFTTDEVRVIANLCSALELSPRSAKRVANVTKLYRMVSARRGTPKPRLVQTSAVALLVGAAAAHPEVQRHALGVLTRSRSDAARPPNLTKWILSKDIDDEASSDKARFADWRHTMLVASKVPLGDGTHMADVSIDELVEVVEFVSSFSFLSD